MLLPLLRKVICYLNDSHLNSCEFHHGGTRHWSKYFQIVMSPVNFVQSCYSVFGLENPEIDAFIFSFYARHKMAGAISGVAGVV